MERKNQIPWKWIILLPWCVRFHPCSSKPVLDLDLAPQQLYSSKYTKNIFRLRKENPRLMLQDCGNHFLLMWECKRLTQWNQTLLAHRCSRLFQLCFKTDDWEVEETEMCNLLMETEDAHRESRWFYYSAAFLTGLDLQENSFGFFAINGVCKNILFQWSQNLLESFPM